MSPFTRDGAHAPSRLSENGGRSSATHSERGLDTGLPSSDCLRQEGEQRSYCEAKSCAPNGAFEKKFAGQAKVKKPFQRNHAKKSRCSDFPD